MARFYNTRAATRRYIDGGRTIIDEATSTAFQREEGSRMSTHATGTVLGTDWQEKTYSEHEGGGKLSHATVKNDYDGAIAGTGTLQYLLAYSPDPKGACAFTGVERVVGSLDGRSGSFVLQHSGTYGADGLKAEWFVVNGSATGELKGLRGKGTLAAAPGDHRAAYTLDYDLG
jgi:hypothetical protein